MAFTAQEREQLEAEMDLLAIEEYRPDELRSECGQHERDIATLVAAGQLHQCAVCGCTEITPCPGGCV